MVRNKSHNRSAGARFPSGIKGISVQVINEFDDEKRKLLWHAWWDNSETGVKEQKSASIGKYGWEEAFRIVLEAQFKGLGYSKRKADKISTPKTPRMLKKWLVELERRNQASRGQKSADRSPAPAMFPSGHSGITVQVEVVAPHLPLKVFWLATWVDPDTGGQKHKRASIFLHGWEDGFRRVARARYKGLGLKQVDADKLDIMEIPPLIAHYIAAEKERTDKKEEQLRIVQKLYGAEDRTVPYIAKIMKLTENQVWYLIRKHKIKRAAGTV